MLCHVFLSTLIFVFLSPVGIGVKPSPSLPQKFLNNLRKSGEGESKAAVYICISIYPKTWMKG